jgi:hypothetical protein
MNPPARLSDHSTRRMLVTFAATTRPRMSKRIVSPGLMLNCSLMNCSTETSASSDGVSSQILPATICSLGSSAARYVMVYSRPSEPRPRTSS